MVFQANSDARVSQFKLSFGEHNCVPVNLCRTMFILLVFRGNFQRTDGNICLGLRSSQSLYTSCRENMHWNSYGQSWERAWPHHIHFSYLAPITGKKKGTQPSVWHFMKETNHWQQEQNSPLQPALRGRPLHLQSSRVNFRASEREERLQVSKTGPPEESLVIEFMNR